ncbi:hypothetical protein ACFX1Q_028098 [Malus domestica]
MLSLGDATERPNDAPEVAEHTLTAPVPPDRDFWHLNVDDASKYKDSGADVVLVTPDGSMPEQAIILDFKASNNEAEYEAPLTGLRMTKDLVVKKFSIHFDSQLITSQITEGKGMMIVATDYFTKQVEAEPMTTMIQTDIERFIWRNIICRFSIP